MSNNNLNGVCFSNAVKVCKEFYEKFDGSVALISRDTDYFLISKQIKDDFESRGVTVKNIVLDDDFLPEPNKYLPLFCFPEDVSLIIAVGSDNLINLAKFFATIFKIAIVAVPTEIAFMNIFSKTCYLIDENLPKLYNVKTPDLCVIDLSFLAGLKKQAFADAYSQVASKLVALVDYKVNCILQGKQFLEFDKILKYVSSLTKIGENENSNKISIINAQINIGQIFKEFGELSGSEKFLAGVLNNLKSSSEFENAFFVNKPLIKLYEVFLRIDMLSVKVVPDYNLRLRELSECLNSSELEIIKGYNFLGFDQLKKNTELLKNSGILQIVRNFCKLNVTLEDRYKYVYKGRQKRASFENNELSRALKISAYLYNGGLLKIINDSGALECLKDF